MTKPRTHYDNLQVSRHASPEVIRAAYKSLVQKWHPDRYPGQREEAQRVIHIISQAFEVLSDPIRRRQHDDWIEGSAKQTSGSHVDSSKRFSVLQAKHHLYTDTQIGGNINLKV